MRRLTGLLLAVVGLLSNQVLGVTIHVPSDHPTIQAAIDIATDGDSVLVSPGTYIENINFLGKTIKLLGSSGAEATIMQAAILYEPLVRLTGNEGVGTEFSGFTLVGSELPTVIEVGNGASPIISRNIIHSHVSSGWAISVDTDSVWIKQNLFYGNEGYACIGVESGNTMIVNNTFNDNTVGFVSLSWQTVAKNNIIANSTDYAIWGYYAELDYNDVWNNQASYLRGAAPGPHDISADPLFSAPGDNDYSLQLESPCIDAGDPDPYYNGPDGTRNDMGMYQVIFNLPVTAGLGVSSENPTHVISHAPSFCWAYIDTVAPQAAFEAEVGTDNDWSVAEMWATSEVLSADTFAVYGGSPLADGTGYFFRIRVSNGIGWGDWRSSSFRMNSVPSMPVTLFPTDQIHVYVGDVKLTVQNSVDDESDSLTYDFEIYSDPYFETLVVSEYDVLEQPDSTVFGPVSGLYLDTEYWWRVRSFDSYEHSFWSRNESFITRDAGVIIQVPADQPTIQTAINLSTDGDTVLVAPGLYTENINFNGKGVLLVSSAGRKETFIEPADPYAPIISFVIGEDTTSVIDGFTIRNTIDACGIYCSASSPIIQNNDIGFCMHTSSGGGVVCENSSARIRNNLIHDNESSITGGGLYVTGFASENLEIVSNIVHNNIARAGSGIGCGNVERVYLARNIVTDNTGDGFQATGIYIGGVDCEVVNNTVVGNVRGITVTNGAGVDVRNNIVVLNDGYGVKPTSATHDYNCVWGNGELLAFGQNDISVDPEFFDPAFGDFGLKPSSPCIDAGDPEHQYDDPDGTRNDIGALAYCSTGFPIAYNLKYGPHFMESEVTTDDPEIFWSYLDTSASTQVQYQLEVGTDGNWSSAEMWSTGMMTSSDTSITYDGLWFDDHVYYYLRIRVHDGTHWGEWKQSRFLARLKAIIKVPADQPSIQAGIEYAIAGDTVSVAPGTYFENIDFLGKAISVIGSEGAEATILQPLDPVSSTVTFLEGAGGTQMLSGFAVTGSVAEKTVVIDNNSLTIISDCIFHDNSSGNVILSKSEALITRNVFYDNTDGDCVYFGGNLDTGAMLLNNTFSDNFNGIYGAYGSNTIVRNNIIVNSSDNGVNGRFSQLDYNNVWNNSRDYYFAVPGIHDTSEDPLFTDPQNFDFALQEGSPCINAGDPDQQYDDPDGTRNDIGAYYFDHSYANPYNLDLQSEAVAHVISSAPIFEWSVPDTFAVQAGYEIEVGTDEFWNVAEMWDPGAIWEDGTSIAYSGLPLNDGNTYHCRLRLHDGEVWGRYDYLSFTMNSVPTIPVHIKPQDGESLPVTLVRLIIQNSMDIQDDAITYDFELLPAADTVGTPVASQFGVPEQPDSTVSDVFTELTGNQYYWWRSRAYDGFEHSEWSPIDSFFAASVGVLKVPSVFPTIQAAINAAVDGDTVLVADGVYEGDGNRDIEFWGKSIKLISENGPEHTVIDCAASKSDNHRGIYFNHYEDPLAVVNGFTIKNAYMPDGGGICCFRSASPTIVNCVLMDNVPSGIRCFADANPTVDSVMVTGSGVGMFISQSSPTIRNSSFSENGSGIWCYDSRPITLENCVFKDNTGFTGGGIYCDGSTNLFLTDCRFEHNVVVFEGYGAGGGIFMQLGGGSELNLTRCTFERNFAEASGAAIECLDTKVTMTDCVFRQNTNGFTGWGIVQIEDSHARAVITGCTFDLNKGVALHCWQRTPVQLDSCLFTRNRGLYCTISCDGDSPPVLRNCTFAGNLIETSGAVIVSNSNSRPTLENCIIAFSGEAMSIASEGTPNLSCTNIYANEGGDWVYKLHSQFGINGNISLDPLFCDRLSGDCHLFTGSPCAPDNNDCGELIGALGVGCSDYLCGDADGNNEIDIDDAVHLVSFIFLGGPEPVPYEVGDADCSGLVDIDDAVYLVYFIFAGGPEPCANCQ